LLRRAWYGLNQAFRHRALANGITPDQYTVLRILSESPGRRLTQSELAETMSSDPNTIASLLRRMEQQRLLERRAHPQDGRAHWLVLRPTGRQKFRQTRRLAAALQQEVLRALPDADRDRFLAQLELVSAACWEAAHPDAA
jgi:DNA-binding MarR family transcriptional regulator